MKKIVAEFKDIPFYLLPIVAVLAFIPLIVYYHPFETFFAKLSWYVGFYQTSDIFTYYKSKSLIFVVFIMSIVILVALKNNKNLSGHKAMIPLILYAIFVVLSTMFSENKEFSLNGIDEHFESVAVLISYCILVFYCYWFVESERSVKFIVYAWLIGIALMGVIGMFQVTCNDLYGTEFGKFLILPKEIRAESEVSFVFEPGRVYLTLLNPNYVGFYAVLTIPILLILFIFSKSLWLKIVGILLNSIVFLCLLGSGARNGIVALFIALIFLLIFFRKKNKEHRFYFFVAYLLMFLIFVLFNIVYDGVLSERLEAGFDIKANLNTDLQKIATNDNEVVITYDGNDLFLMMNVDNTGMTEMVMLDKNGNEVKRKKVDGKVPTYDIVDERFPFTIRIGKMGGCLGFSVVIEGKKWWFSNQTEKAGYYFFSPFGKYTKIAEADTAIFTDYGSLFSGRGYIWARTIPLLKEYIF